MEVAEKKQSKKMLIAVPPAMLQEVDSIARTEHRTRNELVREALRRYIHNFKKEKQGE